MMQKTSKQERNCMLNKWIVDKIGVIDEIAHVRNELIVTCDDF